MGIERFRIRAFAIVGKRLRRDYEHFLDVGLHDGDGEPRIRGFAGIHDPIVSEAPSMIMLHRNVDQHVCKAKREAHHAILIFLKITAIRNSIIQSETLPLGVFCLHAAAFAMCHFSYRAGNRSNRDGDVSRTLGSYSR